MDRNGVRDHVIQSLREILADREVPPIDESTDPMWGLGLDSEDGVDLACTLSDKLHYDIPDKINPLVDDAKNRPRRVGEIVDLVHKLLDENKEGNHG
jgi:hypothetical protein